jgi:hypothetical protein
MSQGCDTPQTQIPKPKPETIRNQNYTNPKSSKPKAIQIPNPKTQDPKVLDEFWYCYIPNNVDIILPDNSNSVECIPY